MFSRAAVSGAGDSCSRSSSFRSFCHRRSPPSRVFFRVAVPLAGGGLAAASALALARGLGEFGATIIFAGSLQGVTQTLPLAIYAQFEADFDVALAIGTLFVLVGAVILVALKMLPATRAVLR